MVGRLRVSICLVSALLTQFGTGTTTNIAHPGECALVSELYATAHMLLTSPELKEYFPPLWARSTEVKKVLYEGMAERFVALTFHSRCIFCAVKERNK